MWRERLHKLGEGGVENPGVRAAALEDYRARP